MYTASDWSTVRTTECDWDAWLRGCVVTTVRKLHRGSYFSHLGASAVGGDTRQASHPRKDAKGYGGDATRTLVQVLLAAHGQAPHPRKVR
eukprot:4376247-Pyramimonas_sp.AAC.1